MTPCPECGEPPHYHSWCTLCARLFMIPREKYGVTLRYYSHREARERGIRAAHAAGLTAQETAAKLGCSISRVSFWKRRLHLSDFVRPEHCTRRRAHALAP